MLGADLIPMPQHSSANRPEAQSPFVRGGDERQLRILVDTGGIPESTTLDLLLEFGHHPDVDMATTTPRGFDTFEVREAPGQNDQIDCVREGVGYRSYTGGWNASAWIEEGLRQADRLGIDPEPVVRRLLLIGGSDDGFDAVIMSNSDTGKLKPSSTLFTVNQALGLVGLFLRSRGNDLVELANETYRLRSSIETQRFVTARHLLHSGWRWNSGYLSGMRGRGEENNFLSLGVFVRFQRALTARDHVMIERLIPPADTDRDHILYHLDAMLLWLGGAFDITARVARDVYDLDVLPHATTWRAKKSEFRKSLQAAAPALSDLTEPGSPTRAVIDLIAEFRNTIHADPIRGVEHHGSGTGRTRLIEFPAEVEAAVEGSCAELGGARFWGLTEHGHLGKGLWDPYVTVQRLIPFAAGALNAIMDATDVERLPVVDSSEMSSDPPTHAWFEPSFVRRVALLNGVM